MDTLSTAMDPKYSSGAESSQAPASSSSGRDSSEGSSSSDTLAGRLPPLSREPGHAAVRLTPAAQKFAWTDPGRNTRASTASTERSVRRPAKSSDPAGVWSPGGIFGTPSGPRGKLKTHDATGLTASLG